MELVTETQTNEARMKLTQVYKFLQALDQMRNQVKTRVDQQLWAMWFRDLPLHDCIDMRTTSTGSVDDVDTDAETDDDIEASLAGAGSPHLLNVRRPILTDAPAPPSEMTGWLKDGWRRVDGPAEYIPTIEDKDEDGNPVSIQFDEDPARPRLFEEWFQAREAWLVVERPARQVMAIFEKLYALHSQMEREAEQVELILGDGVLLWSPKDEESIQHPLLLQRVQLHFDASVPEFTISEAEQPPELYTALLRGLSDLRASAVSELLTDLADHGYHPLGFSETSDYPDAHRHTNLSAWAVS